MSETITHNGITYPKPTRCAGCGGAWTPDDIDCAGCTELRPLPPVDVYAELEARGFPSGVDYEALILESEDR